MPRPDDVTFSSINDLKDPQKLRRVQTALRRFASSIKVPESEIEDLVQTTILKAWRGAEKKLFKEGTALMSWFIKIAQNEWIDRLRKIDTENLIFPESDETTHAQDPHDAGKMGITEPDMETKVELAQVLEIIKTLPPETQEILKLVRDRYTYAEIAETMNMPLGTVMSRLSRARQVLRERTGEADEE